MLSSISVLHIVIVIAVFLALTLIGVFIVKIIPRSKSKFLNPKEYLPEGEIQTLHQVAYLALMAACFVNAMYVLIFPESDLLYFAVFDFALSLYIAITIDKSTTPRKLLVLLLVPYGALTYLLFNYSLIGLFDFIHIPVFIYFIKYYYDKFKEYTESNGLGITIILLFAIIFISFLVTNTVEADNPLDAMVMVSNAFTSNGYSVLGSSAPGKLNSLILVWSGFIISGAGTATLTAAILLKYHHKREKELNERLDKLEELIKNK